MLFVAFPGVPTVAPAVFLARAAAEIAATAAARFFRGSVAGRRRIRGFSTAVELFMTFAGAATVVTFPPSLEMAFAEAFAAAFVRSARAAAAMTGAATRTFVATATVATATAFASSSAAAPTVASAATGVFPGVAAAVPTFRSRRRRRVRELVGRFGQWKERSVRWSTTDGVGAGDAFTRKPLPAHRNQSADHEKRRRPGDGRDNAGGTGFAEAERPGLQSGRDRREQRKWGLRAPLLG
jgi:hypothetical protein